MIQIIHGFGPLYLSSRLVNPNSDLLMIFFKDESSCMMMVITTFVALAAPGFSKSCFDEGGSAADSNITFGGSVVLLLCYEFQTCRK